MATAAKVLAWLVLVALIYALASIPIRPPQIFDRHVPLPVFLHAIRELAAHLGALARVTR